MNVESEAMKATARTLLAADQIDVDGIDFVIDPNTDYFIRDYAVFVKDGADCFPTGGSFRCTPWGSTGEAAGFTAPHASCLARSDSSADAAPRQHTRNLRLRGLGTDSRRSALYANV